MRIQTFIILFFFGLFCSHLFVGSASAASDNNKTEVGVYAYIPSISSGANSDSSGAGYNGVDIDFDYSTSDLLKALDMAAMGYVEHRHNKWIFIIDGVYARFAADKALLSNGLITLNADGEVSQTMLGGFVGYEALEHKFSYDETISADVLAGIRHNDLDIKLGADASLVGLVTEGERHANTHWVDGVIALRAHYNNGPWGVMGWFDIGHGGDSKSTQAVAMGNYQWDNGVKMYGGYRYYNMQHNTDGGDNEDIAVNLDYFGPMFGLAYQF